jgi:hypothetical protein
MTDPVFAKADGQVYCSYEFLAADWQAGDMYRMTLSGVTCTIGTQTAHVPTMIWSNLVVEAADVTAEIAKIPKSDSNVTWNATALASVNAEVDTALNTIVPASPVAGSLNDILSKAAGGNTFDKATDSLEAIADKLLTGAGVTQIASTIADLETTGTVDLLTGTTQDVILEALTIKMPTGAAGGTLNSISIQTDDATPGIIISSTLGAVANLTSEAELGWSGEMRICVGTKIQLTKDGGHGSSYVTKISAKYKAIVSGGGLS